jgi:predicted nucleic acid-binding protein
VAELPAINTSPLIFLTKGSLIDLLQIISPFIIVPAAVATEIQAYGETDVTAVALKNTDWLVVRETPTVPAVIQSWDLGAGESAVVTWGYVNSGTEVILDDLAARRCAATLGIPVRGTLGIVLTAKQRGVIPTARPVLEQLRLCGMYLSDRVMNQALALVGE